MGQSMSSLAEISGDYRDIYDHEYNGATTLAHKHHIGRPALTPSISSEQLPSHVITAAIMKSKQIRQDEVRSLSSSLKSSPALPNKFPKGSISKKTGKATQEMLMSVLATQNTGKISDTKTTQKREVEKPVQPQQREPEPQFKNRSASLLFKYGQELVQLGASRYDSMLTTITSKITDIKRYVEKNPRAPHIKLASYAFGAMAAVPTAVFGAVSVGIGGTATVVGVFVHAVATTVATVVYAVVLGVCAMTALYVTVVMATLDRIMPKSRAGLAAGVVRMVEGGVQERLARRLPAVLAAF
ncbi:hypothetical protein HK102_003854 [Quaeritorhiza haematococci]|nr:hypothetical protein HK102_003854 [Quaeritorhiza haematococci]